MCSATGAGIRAGGVGGNLRASSSMSSSSQRTGQDNLSARGLAALSHCKCKAQMSLVEWHRYRPTNYTVNMTVY